MVRKEITWVDYNEVERTEEFYFNLTKTELRELEFGSEKALSTIMKELNTTKDMSGLVKLYKNLIMWSYGEKTPDGRRFVKGDNFELAKAFMETEAYDKLFDELASDPANFLAFIEGIVPKEVTDQAETDESYREMKKQLAAGENITAIQINK